MSSTEVIKAERPLVERIFQDEIHLASERAGYPVSRHDPVVQRAVADVLLRIGGSMREKVQS